MITVTQGRFLQLGLDIEDDGSSINGNTDTEKNDQITFSRLSEQAIFE